MARERSQLLKIQSDTINKLQARLRTETRQKKAAIALLDNAKLKYQFLLKSYMSDMTKQNDRTQINFKRILLLVGLGGLPLGILTIFIQVPPSCGCNNSSKNTIGSFIRAQQAYFSEKSVFAQSYSLLELGDGDRPAATTHYRYSVEMGKNKSFIYATPTKELLTDLLKLGLTKKDFNSLVGAVAYDTQNKTTVSIMCRSEKQTLDEPPKPVFKQDKFSCPIGFQTIN